MSKRLPPLAQPIFRLGSSHFLAGGRPEDRRVDRQGRPQPLGLYNPEELIDLEHGTGLDLFEAQIALKHGANLNDPAKWRTRPMGVSASAFNSLVPLAAQWYFRR